jgi:hypothetical protein
MAYLIPQIAYDAGLGLTFLNFTYPDVQKPMADPLDALRHDSITSSGLRQTVTERVDTLKDVNLENIPWVDLPALATFMNYAIGGGSFRYYPDVTASAYDTWELVDTKFDPKWNARGLSKCTLKLRRVPGGASSP